MGVYLDQNLSWNEQCDKLYMHIAGKLAVLRRIRSFDKLDLLTLLFEKTIQPVFDYACTAWGNTFQGNMYKLQRAQNYAARLDWEFWFYKLPRWRYCQIIRLTQQ